MRQKIQVLLGLALLIAVIGGATGAYYALRETYRPEIGLAQGPGDISAPAPSGQEGGAEEEPERTKAPDFTVEDGEGNPVKLSDLEGRPVVLNFWASWCPPCKGEMPEFERVYAELGEEVAFFMVNLTDGQRETKETAAQYLSDQGFTFPVYFDTEQEAANTYGVYSIPTTILIDKDGYLITGAQGQIDEKTLRYGISLIWDGDGDGA